MHSHHSTAVNESSNEFALVCAGQGTEFGDDVKKLVSLCSDCRDVFESTEDVLGWSLCDLIYHGPDSRAHQTVIAQPTILALSVAQARHLLACGMMPQVVLGHSLGQYSALVIAEALEFHDALRLVSERGRLMQETMRECEAGMLAVIGLERKAVYEVCDTVRKRTGPVSVACHNDPLQTVISGIRAAIDTVGEYCEQQGATAVALPVDVPFHSDLLKPMLPQFQRLVEAIKVAEPRLPVIDTVTGTPLNYEDLRDSLVAQIISPVLFEESVRYVSKRGFHRFIQCGSGSTLLNCIKRIVPGAIRKSFNDAIS